MQVVETAAERSGIRLEWIVVADAEKALRSGEVDLFPLLTVTPDRERDLHIGPAWWESTQTLLSLQDRPLADPSATAGKRIAIRDLNYGSSLWRQLMPDAVLIRTHDTRLMITNVCAGTADGALLDGRLIYNELLGSPPECSGRSLNLAPLPKTRMAMATVSTRAAAKTADRLFAAIDQLALDGTMTNYSNQWFVMPQQRYVQTKLSERERDRLAVVFAAAGLILLALNVWHSRRAIRVRRAA